MTINDWLNNVVSTFHRLGKTSAVTANIYKTLYAYINPYRPGSDRTKRLRKKKYMYRAHGDVIIARIMSRRATGKSF